MKKKILSAFVLGLLFFSSPVSGKEKSTETIVNSASAKAEQKAEAKLLIARLKMIREAVEGKELSIIEKNNYRKEVRSIQDKLKTLDGVHIYLSGAAIIIIILLIIIL